MAATHQADDLLLGISITQVFLVCPTPSTLSFPICLFLLGRPVRDHSHWWPVTQRQSSYSLSLYNQWLCTFRAVSQFLTLPLSSATNRPTNGAIFIFSSAILGESNGKTPFCLLFFLYCILTPMQVQNICDSWDLLLCVSVQLFALNLLSKATKQGVSSS